jgi:hypothetical protein
MEGVCEETNEVQLKAPGTDPHTSRILTDPSTIRDTRFLYMEFRNQPIVRLFTVATPGLLCQLRVIVKMIVEKQMECRLAGKTEVLRENLPQRHFCPSQNHDQTRV